MKINSVQTKIALLEGGSGLRSESLNFREKSGADMRMKNRGYSANNCGSFTGKEEAAANVLKKAPIKGLGNKILASEWFNKFLQITEEHNVATSAFIALILAGILRPLTTMALPGKDDREDKIYASGHAIASAIMGFVVSLILTSPLDGALTKTFDASEKVAGIKPLKDGENLKELEEMSSKKLVDMFKKTAELDERIKTAAKADRKSMKQEVRNLTRQKDAMNTLLKNAPEWVIAIPRSILTIAMIPPILKYVFGLEKKKKAAPVEQTPAVNNVANNNLKIDFNDKPIFKEIVGGAK